MKNPFPGMNPFIEGYKWSPFQGSMIINIQEELIEQLTEVYLMKIETTIYDNYVKINDTVNSSLGTTMAEDDNEYASQANTVKFTPPTKRLRKQEVKVSSLHILDSENRELVTSIELLSPANKTGYGSRKYRKMRRRLPDLGINLLEIDLLREGHREDTIANSSSPYQIQLVDEYREEILEWSVGLFDRLPTIPVPLHLEADPLILDLQSVFERTFRLSTLPRSLSNDVADLRPPIEDVEDLKVLESYLAEVK